VICFSHFPQSEDYCKSMAGKKQTSMACLLRFFSIAFIFKIVVIVLLRISGMLHRDIFSFGRASICVDFTACFISMC